MFFTAATTAMPSQDYAGTWSNNDDDYLEIDINAEENRIIFVWFNHRVSSRRKEGTAKLEDGKIKFVIQDFGEGTSVEATGTFVFDEKGISLTVEKSDAFGNIAGQTFHYPVKANGGENESPSVSQKLAIPPKINFFQYTASISQHDLYGLPSTRIWGWSNDGKVAYSVAIGIEGRGGQIIYFVILDSVSDSEVFKLIMDSFDYNDVEDEALYNLSRVHILNALRMHNIVRQETNFLPFPFKRNNRVYDCRITNVEYKDGEGFFDGGAVSRYNVLVTAGNKSKIINSFTPVGLTGFVYVCGYFLSPFENRALVVVAEEQWGHEGTELDYRLSGCHLEAGFN
jgi:hypothetical protein